MNRTPSILVDTGFRTDQNGALTEFVFPEVVNTLNAPTKITFNGSALNYIPSVQNVLQELDCPNATSVDYVASASFLKGYSVLTKVKLPSLLSINRNASSNGFVYNCPNVTEIDLSGLKTIQMSSGNYSGGDLIYSCPSLATIRLDSLESFSCPSDKNGDFMYGNYGFTTLALPKLKTVDTGTNGMFGYMLAMTSFTLGSEGNPVERLGSNTFKGCTQSGLTITIYTTGGAALSGEPWGATNAVIEYEEA